MKVLLAEDDFGVRESLIDLLSERAELVAVSSVAEGLGQLSARRFELVMTDLSLNGQRGGWEIAREARRRLMPVVIASGAIRDVPSDSGPFVLQGKLEKPFSVERVFALVDRFEALVRVARACAAGKQADGACVFHEFAPGALIDVAREGAGCGVVVQSGRLVCEGRVLGEGELGFFERQEPACWRAESSVRLASVTLR